MERKTKDLYRQSGRDHGCHPVAPVGPLRRAGFGQGRSARRITCNQAQCHVGTAINGGGGSVKVTFPGGATYAPGVKQHLVVTIADPTARIWGFQLTARPSSDPKTQAGSFTSTDRFTAVVCSVPPVQSISRMYSSISGGTRTAPPTKPLAYIEHTPERQLADPAGIHDLRVRLDAARHRRRQHHDLRRRQRRQRQRPGDGRPHLHRELHADAAAAGPTPAIDTGGVVSGASFLPGIVPGLLGDHQGQQSLADHRHLGRSSSSTETAHLARRRERHDRRQAGLRLLRQPGPDQRAGARCRHADRCRVTVTTPSGTSAALHGNAGRRRLRPSSCGRAIRRWPRAISDASLAVKNGTFAGSHHGRRQARRRADSLGHRLRPHSTRRSPAGILTPATRSTAPAR